MYLVRSASGAFGIDLSEEDLQTPLQSAKEMFPPQVISLAQSISQGIDGLLGGEEVRQTIFCEICLVNVEESERYSLRGCENEDHCFCAPCLSTWLESRIADGVTSIPCPMRSSVQDTSIDGDVLSIEEDLCLGCNGLAADEDIENLCSEEAQERYKRFKLLHGPNGDQFRECPRCGCLNRGGVLRNAVSFVAEGFKPTVRCRQCQHRFCFYHGDAHPLSSSCIGYAVRQRRDAAQRMSADSRPCPGCGSPTFKVGGCNHMTCTHCERLTGSATEWCWLCNKNFGTGQAGRQRAQEHYGADGKGCPGGQFAEASAYRTTVQCKWLARAIGVAVSCAALGVSAYWTWRTRYFVCVLLAVSAWECCRWRRRTREGARPAGPGAESSPWLLWLTMAASVLWVSIPAAMLVVLYLAFSMIWAIATVALTIALSPLIAFFYWALRYCGRRRHRIEHSVDFILAVEQYVRVTVLFPLLGTRYGDMLTASASRHLECLSFRKSKREKCAVSD